MINNKKKGFVYKTLILTLATIFSYSVTNSIVVSNITGIDELGSIAFAKKEGKGDKGDKGKGTSGGPNYPSKEELQNIVDNLKGSGTTDKYQVRDDEGNPTGEWVYGAEYGIDDVDIHGYPEGWKQERVTKDGEEFNQITTKEGRVYWKPVGGGQSDNDKGDTTDSNRSAYQTDEEKAASDAATAARDADALALEQREKRRKLRLQKPWLFGRLSLLSGRNELGVTSSLLGGG